MTSSAMRWELGDLQSSVFCLRSYLSLCSYQQPDSSLSLMKLEKALRQEAEKLEEMKKERMEEVILERVGSGLHSNC